MEARARQFGIADPTFAPLDIETNVIGKLFATRELSRRQYEAATRYRTAVAEYDRVSLVRGLPKAGDLDRGGGYDGADPFDPNTRQAHEDDYRTAVRRWEECERALQDANREDKHASYTVKAQVIADWSAPYFIPALRVGLNHLARVFRLSVNDENGRVDISRKSADVQSM